MWGYGGWDGGRGKGRKGNNTAARPAVGKGREGWPGLLKEKTKKTAFRKLYPQLNSLNNFQQLTAIQFDVYSL